MKVKSLGANRTVVDVGNTQIFFSYETAVAGSDGLGFFRTDTHYSRTTSKHITQYLDGRKARTVAQWQIDALLVGVGEA